MDNAAPVKMVWVAMLTKGNSLGIGGFTFNVNVPIRITADLAEFLRKNKLGSFKIWQHPSDQPLPQVGVPQARNNEVTTASMRAQKVEDVSKEKSAKDFIVRPNDVKTDEAVVVAATPTPAESWPEEAEDEPVEQVEPEDEPIVEATSGYTGEGTPSVVQKPTRVLKKRITAGKVR